MRLPVLAILIAPQIATAQARFDVPRDTMLTDERLRIALQGAAPRTFVTIRMDGAGQQSEASFIADQHGTVDLTRDQPIVGSYSGVDAMGLFWTARREGIGPPPGGGRGSVGDPHKAIPFQVVAEAGGSTIATDTVWRRFVAPGVKITEIRDAGFTATLYEPPSGGRHAAVVLLTGSQGGRLPPSGFPGGLASRGYVALALAYFNDEGVPPSISGLPLEYFEHALKWLRARPNVDSSRIGLQGGSKGGETSLIIASAFPSLVHAVVAFVPSNVVWNGCCDSVSALGPSYTLGGKPLPYVPAEPALASSLTGLSRTGPPVRQAALYQFRLADTAAVARATIPVERIRGPVLLISATDDGQWPSTLMSDLVIARLRANKFRYPYKHVAYAGAGHQLGRPYLPPLMPPVAGNAVTGRRVESGGTPLMTQRAREQAWNEVLAFFDEHLRGRQQKQLRK
jgi:dienelactone hydrolase